MKNTDDILRELAALARQAPAQPRIRMPEGFPADILRRLPDRTAPAVWLILEPILPRFLAVAAAVCLLILCLCLWLGNPDEPSDLELANAAAERMLLP
jgi:hypothetical protein